MSDKETFMQTRMIYGNRELLLANPKKPHVWALGSKRVAEEIIKGRVYGVYDLLTATTDQITAYAAERGLVARIVEIPVTYA